MALGTALFRRPSEQIRDAEGSAYIVGTAELRIVPMDHIPDRVLRKTVGKRCTRRRSTRQGTPYRCSKCFYPPLHRRVMP